MSTLTPNIGLEKVTSSQTVGELQESMNGSGRNMDILDAKIGAVGNTSLQAQVSALDNKLSNFLQFGNAEFTITDASFGFIDSGVSSVDYVILAAYCLLTANCVVQISNLNTGTANYRFQVMAATNQSIYKSGTYRIYYVYVARSKLGS